MSDSESHALPSEIAGYRIIKMLGEGGMSVVYAAMPSQPKRMVALKVLKGTSFLRPCSDDSSRKWRFSAVATPGIAQVYDAGTRTTAVGKALLRHGEHSRWPGTRCLSA